MAASSARRARESRSGPVTLRSPAFVGRGRELAALGEALADPPAVVLVEGEAGIGKSRLVQEFLALPAGKRLRSLVAVCPPFREPHTLGSVVDALRQATPHVRDLRLSGLAGALRPLFPEWSVELPPLPEPAEDATAARHRLFRALHELLDALRVAVLVVEDAHWVDDATAEFLLFLVSQRPPRISVVATYRPEDLPVDSLVSRLPARLPAGSTQRLRLEAFTVEEIGAFVSSMLHGEQVTATFVTFLHDGTDGLPLAVEESVRLMHDQADLTLRGGGWVRRPLDTITIPPTVREAVLKRFRRLSPHAQMVLCAAAVLAEASAPSTLQAVGDLDALDTAAGLDEALGAGLLREDARGLVTYRHALAGRAVYDVIPPGRRRALHLRAGRALEHVTPQPVARLARHFRHAGESLEWCRYAERAADEALAAGDDTIAAVTLYDVAVGATLPPGTLLRVIDKLPLLAMTGTDRFDALVRALRSITDGGGLSPAEEAQARWRLGIILHDIDHYEESRVELERAVRHPALAPQDAIRVMTMLGWPTDPVRSVADHRRWLRRAAKLLPTIEPPVRTRAALDRMTTLLLLGEEEGWTALRELDDATATLSALFLATRDVNAGEGAMIWGRYAEADRRLDAALSLAERHEYPRLRGEALVNRMHLDWYRGAWDGLAGSAGALTDDGTLPPVRRAEAVLVVALLKAAAGAYEQARQDLESVLAAARARKAARPAVEFAGALAGLLLGDGDVAGALAVTEEPIGIVARKGIWLWAAELAPARVAALIAAGRDGEAADLVDGFGRGLRGRDAPAPRAALLTCRAALTEARTEPARAAAAFARAAAAWAALPRPYDALLARERAAGCLLAAGRHEQALAELSQVFQDLTALGAPGEANRVKRVLREHHVDVRPTGRLGRPGYGGRLSPREREVVELVIAGHTNRQIAEKLVVSAETVTSHVKSAMRKLGVSSRTALAVRAIELGETSERL